MASPNRVHIQSGNTSIPWIRLFITVDILKNTDYKWPNSGTAMAFHHGLTIYLSVTRWPRVLEMLDDNPGLHNNTPVAYIVLMYAKGKKATDPKDKVFALYSLFRELSIELPKPDYEKSLEQIYREATVASIKYDKLLNILYYCPSDNRRLGLRSWVPDWSDPAWESDDSRSAMSHSRFAACGPSDPRWHFADDDTKLIVMGKIFDTVMYRSETMPDKAEIYRETRNGTDLLTPSRRLTEYGNKFLDFTRQCLKTFKAWLEVSQWSNYSNGESAQDAFRRTIIQDSHTPEIQYFDQWLNILQASDSRIMELALDNTTPEWRQEVQPLLHETFLSRMMERVAANVRTHFALGETSNFCYYAMEMTCGKCFFRTENGYFGTAPDPASVCVEAGDKVAVVSGLAHPLLLRPVEGGGYRLLTHIYLHGIMYGEAWPDNDSVLEELALV